jgi:MEMO1 family protein
MFYPADPQACRQLAASYVRQAPDAAVAATGKPWVGGIVPHAGWICSGAVAGQTLAAIAAETTPDLVVVFGAVHSPAALEVAALDTHDQWLVPGGDASLPSELQQMLVQASELFQYRADFHRREHAVEVEVPLIQQLWPSAALLPIEVPLIDDAIEIGVRTARQITAAMLRPVFLASSDLTHYGPNYGLTAAGVGEQGIRWAFDNDRRLLDLVVAYEVGAIVPEVRDRTNACGGGAIAAMMAAAREFGATQGRVLRQTNSYQTLAAVAPQPLTNAVGYAAVVVG